MSLLWSSQRQPAWVRYGAALILVAIAGTCNYLMPPVYGESHYFFFSVAILAAALLGGWGPGILATTVSALVSAYLFIAPFHSFRVEAPEAAERLAMFVIEGAIISSVGHVIRYNRTPELISAMSRYGSAIILVAGATILKLLLFPSLEGQVPFTFFYSAVVATSWIAGAGPGLTAAALATATIYLVYLRKVTGSPGDPALALFAFEATALCLMTAVFRQRLLETEAHLGRVFVDSPTGIVILERNAEILRANPAFRHILDADRFRLDGSSLIDFVHPDSREQFEAFLSRLNQQHSVDSVEEVCLTHNSSLAWTNMRGSWIREDSRKSQTCMVMVEDITERRRAEEALREAQIRLERGQRAEAIGMFAGGIAHDFNNLLAVIFNCCERQLFLKDLAPDARAYTEEILHTAKTAADLTHQLLAFARRQPRSAQMVLINRLVTESSALLQRLLGPRIELTTELKEDAGQVRADPGQLQQILMNLAANARDAMPSGGRLTIRTLQTEVAILGASPPKQYVTLEVSDTGHGMDEATLARIFEPLFSTKELEKGTGLGLATVQSIVKRLGGYIAVESSPGNGARFSIQLPAADPTAERPRAVGQSEKIFRA